MLMHCRLSLCAVRIVAASPSILQISSAAVEFVKTTFFSIPQPVARLRLATLLSMVALRQGLVVQSFSFLHLAADSCYLANDCEYCDVCPPRSSLCAGSISKSSVELLLTWPPV